RVPQWVSTRALATTLAHLASPDSPHPFPGLPLTRFWEGDGAASETLYAGSGYAANNPVWYPTMKGDIQGVLDGDLMLIREADARLEMYQPGADPWMTHDLLPGGGSDTAAGRLETLLEQEVGPPVLHPSYRPPQATDAAR
ncbi:MAG: hypothetical protein OEV95_03960, partial [Gemmatimonadota bacterium]|nr:hypothetical protein [Gemmatimonadota bacterium]